MALEVLSIDLSSTMIACLVSAIVIFISYLIYRFGIAEKSFEDAIEEQKRRAIEEELQQKLEKGKKEKKFKKTWGKKSKEKIEHDAVAEISQPEEKKDAVPSIEIIEPKEVKSIKQKNKIKANSSNSANASSDNSANASSVVEKSKKLDSPVISVKPVQDKKDVEPLKEAVKLKTEPKIHEIVKSTVEIIENVPSTIASSVQATAPVSGKKKKKEQIEKDAVPLTSNKLLALIKETELDTEEVQTLIDILLNKQKDSAGWTKKNDQLALTKKNLQEKEQLLDQEQRQNQAVTTKLKDLREEYNLLKTKYSAMEKSSQEKISRHQQEVQTLTVRVKQIQEQLSAEKEKCVQAEKEIETRVENSMKKLEEENAKLQQKVAKLETESRSGVSKNEYETIKKSKEDLQKVHSLLVEQHTQLIASHKNDLKNLHAQVADSKPQVEELNAKNKILLKDIQILNDNKTAMELSKRALEEKLLAAEKHSTDLEVQVKCLTAKIADFTNLQTELKDLRLENEKLAEQLVSTKERVAGDGQEVVHQNGELNGKVQEVSFKSLDETDKLLKEKEAALAQLTDDLNKHQANAAVLREELESQKLKNNELREKNWKAMDALKTAEKNAEQRIKEIQSASDEKITHIEKEMAEKIRLSVTKAEPNHAELEGKLRNSENNSAQRLSDYNAEVEKNKKLTVEIDRITNLHQSSISKIAEVEATVEELHSELTKCRSKTREGLQRIFPDLHIESTLPYELWLEEFKTQAASLVTTVSSPNDNVSQLLEEKEKEFLENQRHYERVLGETESTLRKLQEQAESQEALWQERLNKKEEELKQVLSEKEALAAEKEAVQSTFQQMGQLEELQEKLKLLQSTLETAESERSHLEQKFDEVNKNCINLRDQLENKEKQLTDLQKERNSVDTFKQDIEDLKSKLEKEKKINKDFSSQMIRLNSLVKIGQDALSAEQEMVKKLKSQLEASQVSPANGTASTTISSPVKNIESQPKKSSERKKRMDASANK